MAVHFRSSLKMWLIVLGTFPAMAARMRWEHVRCSTDVHALPEGRLGDNSRFPWLGVLQHNFQYEKFSKFAISPAILIHPVYALAGARDVQAIPADRLSNFTKFISLRAGGGRSAMPAVRAVLHPEYPARSVASVALVELDPRGAEYIGNKNPGPVLPVCLPYSGAGAFNDEFYTIHMTDEGGVLGKKVFKMSYLDDKTCDEFYEQSGLNISRMSPVHSVCVSGAAGRAPCVWDEGSALVTRQKWDQFKLLGFGVRGPGCGAPARFLYIHRYLTWMEEVIVSRPGGLVPGSGRRAGLQGLRRLVVQQRSTDEIYMHLEDESHPGSRGYCRADQRGFPLYRDQTAVRSKGNNALGYYYLEIHGDATFQCLTLRVATEGHTDPQVWVEHHCYKDTAATSTRDYDKAILRSCFKYFISTAHVEFRFRFSFEGSVYLTMYGFATPTPTHDIMWVKSLTKVWQPTTTDLFLPRLFRTYLESDTPTEW